ncbi:ribokinase [Thermoflexibacter ruber]|uniref:Ribokinase n=1 Tax=Thermoflexibacter ruber TaxID=1003 RepID=A0A1I2EJ34_9BACT|nr:ribokinase [Thermoflexibacter ruber]SFE93084.1 ribokinase [Thermoflexibacter ruber]
MNIVVIGSTNIDMIAQVPHLPQAGETVIGGTFSQAYGGKGANQAVAASRMGGQVTFISCVGDDTFGTEVIQHFQKEGIYTDFVFKEKNVATGIALIMVDEKGTNSIAVASGANERLSPQHIDQARQVLEEADIVLLQLEIPLATVIYAIDLAKQMGKKVLLNPAPAQRLPKSLLSKVDILIPNEIEAEMLTGIRFEEEIKIVGENLLSLGVETVIITLGEKGCYVIDSQSARQIPAPQVKAIDTTAAGDVFCGTLAVSLAEQRTLIEAVHFANAAAALSVTKVGAQPSAPCKSEIENFLKGLLAKNQ